jgi:hypothetical protein
LILALLGVFSALIPTEKAPFLLGIFCASPRLLFWLRQKAVANARDRAKKPPSCPCFFGPKAARKSHLLARGFRLEQRQSNMELLYTQLYYITLPPPPQEFSRSFFIAAE